MGSKAFKVDKSYTHFAVRKLDSKIVNGWDYKDTDKDDIQYWCNIDFKDNDQSPKDYKVVQKDKLIKSNINPMDWSNWGNNYPELIKE